MTMNLTSIYDQYTTYISYPNLITCITTYQVIKMIETGSLYKEIAPRLGIGERSFKAENLQNMLYSGYTASLGSKNLLIPILTINESIGRMAATKNRK